MSIFGSVFEHFWEPFWGPFWDQIGQRGGKMSPREPSGASKSQKDAFSKTLKKHVFFKVFGSRGLPRDPQEAQEGSQEAPKELQKTKKKTKMYPIFGTPFPRISGVQIMPRQKFRERGEKPTGAGIILSKRKGGIRPL